MSADQTKILEDLIRCASVTPRDEGALGVVQSLLENAGFTCERLVFQDKDTPDIDNLFAWIGAGEPHICFAGHTDVVPAGDESIWTHPPFAAEIHSGQIYGRGATDMKGSVAAFTSAALDFLNGHENFKGKISFLITGDEEGPAINGTAKVLQWMKQHGHVPDHCLVGEPTCVDQLGDTIKIGRRGSLSFSVTVDGKQGHAAYPQKADNPVTKLARFIDRIATTKLDDGNAHFEPSTLAVTTFDVGNNATNVIPSKAHAKFNIRFSSEHSFNSLKALVNDHIAEVKAELGGTWHVSATEGAEAFINEPGEFVLLVQAAVKSVTGLTPKLSTSGGTSDARFVKNYCEVLEFGPTNATIHQTDERLSVAELEGTTNIYRTILENYFK